VIDYLRLFFLTGEINLVFFCSYNAISQFEAAFGALFEVGEEKVLLP
jgi:hypothetical protein